LTQLTPKASLPASLDAIVEAVALPRDPWARSAVVCSLVNQMCAAVGWLHEPDTPLANATDVELASIGQLAKAAQDHPGG
jgi:hypothetical protein